MVEPSHTKYRWTTHKTTLAYIVTQYVSNFGNDDILREDNIHNVVCIVNEKSQIARAQVTNNYVRIFL
jgi:hypothetical protein